LNFFISFLESKGIISFNMQQPRAKPLAKRRPESESVSAPDDEDSGGSEWSDDDWTKGPSPVRFNGKVVIQLHHRLAEVVAAVRKPNQTSMERYWETQRINQQQPRAKRRLESVSAPEGRLAKPQVAAPVSPVEPTRPVVVTIDDSDKGAGDAISIILVADSDDLCEP
jgi:hypothetical protein